jgi:hypothetical protein
MSARARIEEVLQSIRPAIQADGGDVELIDSNEAVERYRPDNAYPSMMAFIVARKL